MISCLSLCFAWVNIEGICRRVYKTQYSPIRSKSIVLREWAATTTAKVYNKLSLKSIVILANKQKWLYWTWSFLNYVQDMFVLRVS